ncbi:DUF6074 family protein [Sinorhizobium terangae]|uniref:DUF6074 family protein n=1 Tax=Sinorhizobium terangae TaxID=110322 RepID=UPI0024B054DC|nr:DUF6074 family protein [Sinorhizobium terangae]WFU52005.1 DUF6074 family protein [Sinorhizobium terangae]
MSNLFNLYEGLAAIVAISSGDSPGNDGDSMTVLQFPANRRMGDVKRCAEALQRLHGEQANRFWRSEMTDFAAALRRSGIVEEEISRQAGLFMHAVQMELQVAFAIEENNASA